MKSDCNLIKDLVGAYTDKVASESTEAIIKEHLSECKECRYFYKIYKNAEKDIPEVTVEPDVPNFPYDEKYLNISNLLKRKKKIKNSSLVAMGVFICASTTLNIILLKKLLK